MEACRRHCGYLTRKEFDVPDSATPSQDQGRVPRRSDFDLVAEEYDRPSLRAFRTGAERLVELAALRNGHFVLDAGSGTGHATVAAARAVGPQGRVVAVDVSAEMCERARQKVMALGLATVEVRQGDGAALALPAGSFDAVICASALYTFPDIQAALSEWGRVLKPGGRVAFSALGAGSHRLYGEMLQRYGILLPAGLPTQRIDSTAKCEAFLRGAGFDEIESHAEQLGYYLADAEECWEIVWYTGARIPLTYLPPPVLERFKADYLAALAASATERGIWIDWPCLFALARKPGQSGSTGEAEPAAAADRAGIPVCRGTRPLSRPGC
jgi:ubiquinone/menaquinone biosynthesis C-methylase UbiE